MNPDLNQDVDGEEDTTGGKKKKRKRTNKKNLAKLKELRREFMERCVSPSYHAYNSFSLNGEVSLTNLRDTILAEEEDHVYKNTRSRAAKKKKGPPILIPKTKKSAPLSQSLPSAVVNAVQDSGMTP